MNKVSIKKRYPQYKSGGWLQDNWLPLAQTAAGAAAMFIPGGQAVGVPLIAGGVSGMAGNAAQQAQQSEQEKLMNSQIQTQQNNLKAQQFQQNIVPNTPTFKGGGKLKNPNKANDYTKWAPEPNDSNTLPNGLYQTLQAPPPTPSPKVVRYRGQRSPLMEKITGRRYRLGMFEQGGNIKGNNLDQIYVEYDGQSHEGPDEGIEVDNFGQPTSVSNNEAVALTEGGEVSYDGQVFSDSTKLPGNKKRTFADEAKRITNKYKFYLGKNLDKTEPTSRKALERELKQLFDIQESAKGNMMHTEDVEQLLAQQQQAQSQQVQQEMMQDPALQDPMTQQMQMQQQGMPMQQPMMRKGGKLPKYNDAGLLPHNFITGIPSSSMNPFSVPSPVTPVQDSLGNIPIIPTTTPQQIGDKIIGVQPTQINPNYEALQPSPVPAIVGAGMGVLNAGVGLWRNRRGTRPALNLGRMTPEQINLEQQRIAARNRANTTGSTIRRDMARRGASQGTFQAGISGAMSDINRNLGEQIGQSYLTEETTNAQARQQAQAANMQAQAQEQMFNTQAEMQRRATQDQLIASGLNTIPAAYMDYQTQVGRQNMMNAMMAQGDYGMYQEVYPNAPTWRRRLGLNRSRPTYQAHEYIRSLRS